MNSIIIIGSGWYGLHIFLYIKNNFPNYNIIILEKNSKIFNNSSYFNQNRLHLGYHYPRTSNTRDLCKKSYKKFIENYNSVIDDINNNYYCISKDSFIDYDTYIKIYSNDDKYNHSIIENTFLENIDGFFIKTNEKVINSKKARKFFENNISQEFIKYNYNVTNIKKKDLKIIVNDELECDLLIDCTYNQLNLNLDLKYIYELTISLIYKRCNYDLSFGALTIMDGNFFSIYPMDIINDEYTLTHVKYTPLIVSEDINDIKKYIIDEETVLQIKTNIETDVIKYYRNFHKDFKYLDYFISFKCKSVSNNDSRSCNIKNNDNIISVNCGKISGIFEFEDYIKEYLNNK
jgi:hypothetical protein